MGVGVIGHCGRMASGPPRTGLVEITLEEGSQAGHSPTLPAPLCSPTPTAPHLLTVLP